MRKAVDWGPRPHGLGGWATGITTESDSEQFVKMGAVGGTGRSLERGGRHQGRRVWVEMGVQGEKGVWV